MRPAAAPGKGRQNGYLVFGDGSAKTQLIQCGVLLRRKTAAIIEGTGNEAPRVEEKIPIDGKVTLEIDVDLASGEVALSAGGKTTSRMLERKLKKISYVGYGVQNATTDFGPVEVTGE